MNMESERNWATLCHLLSFSGLVIPLGNLLGPLIAWNMKKDASSYVDEHGRESVNFQISMLIYGVIGGVLSFIFSLVTFGYFLILAIPAGFVFAVFQLVCVVKATLKSQEGQYYRYPFSIRFF